MTITIFGATGKTGLLLTAAALERGHEVVAFVRSPEKLGKLRPRVKVIAGDVMSLAEVSAAIKPAGAIISVLGLKRDSPENFQTDATKTIVQAAEQAGVKRLITLTGANVRTEGDRPGLPDKLISVFMGLFLKRVLEDANGHAVVVRHSHLDWTIVRAPILTDAPATGKYAVGMVGDSQLSISVPRADVAAFILDILDSADYTGKMPVVATASRRAQ